MVSLNYLKTRSGSSTLGWHRRSLQTDGVWGVTHLLSVFAQKCTLKFGGRRGISHTKPFWLCANTRRKVGNDCERPLTPDVWRLCEWWASWGLVDLRPPGVYAADGRREGIWEGQENQLLLLAMVNPSTYLSVIKLHFHSSWNFICTVWKYSYIIQPFAEDGHMYHSVFRKSLCCCLWCWDDEQTTHQTRGRLNICLVSICSLDILLVLSLFVFLCLAWLSNVHAEVINYRLPPATGHPSFLFIDKPAYLAPDECVSCAAVDSGGNSRR